MISQCCGITRTLIVPALLWITAAFIVPECAVAKTADSSRSPATSSPRASTTAVNKASAEPANPRIYTVRIIKRVNQELGIDLEATTAGWQHELF
jgi:Tfp pilus assembly protein FimV